MEDRFTLTLSRGELNGLRALLIEREVMGSKVAGKVLLALTKARRVQYPPPVPAGMPKAG
jgi:hypothetical protein